MRGPVLEEPVVVGRFALAPAAFGVVTRLLRQQRSLFGVEIDGAFAIRVVFWLVQVVHGTKPRPRRRVRLPLPAVPSVNVSTPTGVPDDEYWQRPDQAYEAARPAAPAPDPAPEYEGPPRTDPPSPHWRPPTVAQPPPPRTMPAQDMDALDEAEGSAKTVTFGVGLVAGAIVLILMCLLCARAIF